MNAARYMSMNTTVLRPTEYLESARRKMSRPGIRALPVVGTDGQLVGLLSKNRLAQIPNRMRESWGDMKVEQIMSRRVHCCRPTDNIGAVVATMDSLKMPLVPIIDENGRFKGVVTPEDLPFSGLTAAVA